MGKTKVRLPRARRPGWLKRGDRVVASAVVLRLEVKELFLEGVVFRVSKRGVSVVFPHDGTLRRVAHGRPWILRQEEFEELLARENIRWFFEDGTSPACDKKRVEAVKKSFLVTRARIARAGR